MQFPVYKINPCDYYTGTALVAANNAVEANQFIDSFVTNDKDNKRDSLGYDYVNEDDKIDYLFSTVTGIIDYGIWYRGTR